MKKQGEKQWKVSINKKSPKFNKKTRKKINYLCFICYFVEDKKPLKPS